MLYYAHTLKDRPPEDWEPLEDHLKAVADQAGKFANAFGAEDWGAALGLWHDIGKYSAEFQNYIRPSHANSGDDAHELETSGRVDHSTAGAVHASSLGPLTRLLAYGIAGHHAGLPNNVGTDSSLSRRLERASTPERMVVFDSVPTALLDREILKPPMLRTGGNRKRQAFAIGFFTRMLFSCLVDADFLATEEFMDPERSALRPKPSISLERIRDQLDTYLNEKATAAPRTAVNRQRQEVLAACRAKAMLPPGFFSLNVPTGGGKTFSSLAFALSHAVKNELGRVVYAIPFTSIIEQTANVFREALGDYEHEVLEHHSNLDSDKQHSMRTRLAAENWDSRLVVTTNVQLFESMFASRTSRSRKLHRLARSVIVLDEAQILPPNLLEPTLAALDELVRNYGATVVLCTATQPAIQHRAKFPIGLDHVTPIIDEPLKLHAALRRTRVGSIGPVADNELIRHLHDERQALCIVNSRNHAAVLYRELDDPRAFHLSANLCAAHRSDIVAKIRKRLDPNNSKPCRVISTQVIEAGVDVDFPVVYRAAAGLDSIAQAAGRCNREGGLTNDKGEPALGRVVVFDYDEKVYRTPPFIKHAANHFREVAPDHSDDLLSPDAIEEYFRLHYWQQGRIDDDGRGWDEGRGKESIMDCFDVSGNELHAQYRDAAERYQMIDDATTPILVPYKKGRDLIRELADMQDNPEPRQLRGFDRRAQRYVVGVREHGLRKLLGNGVLLERHERYYIANDNAYQEGLGLTFEGRGLDSEYLIA